TSTTATIDFPGTTFTASIKVGAVNGCGTGALKALSAYAKPAVPTITGNTTVCNNALETYTATAGASSYIWTIPSGATFVGSSIGNTVQVQFGTIPVNPKITVKNYNGCTYNTKLLTLVWGSCKTDEALNSSVEEVESEMGISNLNVFPNPSSSVFNISFNSNTDGEQMNIRVFDVAGKLVKEINELSHAGSTNVAVDLSSEASGLYVMSLQTQGVTKRIRLLKQ
ncbi:MAG: T9SS type A sorting domain-containing protein, partial [Bacteroidetes bacterium]|nr:T9SS type A sorting domain-containing protein [Bacteroidota bacterium]